MGLRDFRINGIEHNLDSDKSELLDINQQYKLVADLIIPFVPYPKNPNSDKIVIQ